MRSRPLIASFLFLATLTVPAASLAQLAGPGAGSIVGVVKDATGGAVRDVAVTIEGPSLGRLRTTTSAADGEYRLLQLPPGDFVLTFTLSGFEPERREVHVGLAATLTIDVTLAILSSRESIVVTGTLDRQSTTISQSFTARQLETLPSSRSLAGLFALTQGLALPSIEVGGGSGIVSGAMGAYGRNNSPRHTIEGIVVTGLFGAGFSPDYGALEEVSVLTAGHGAEWGTAGIHTDIVTKSGSNEYRGTFYAAGQDRRLQSTNIDVDQILRGKLTGGVGVPPNKVNQLWSNADVNADMGGFLRKELLWWYASGRRQDVATRLVNFEARPYVTRLTNYSGKLTARTSPRHSLVFYGQQGLNHQPYRLDPFISALSPTTAINRAIDSTVDQRNTSRLWKAEWNAVLSNSFVFELRAGQWASNFDWTPRSAEPRTEDLVTFEVRGGNRDWESTQRRNQFVGSASYFTRNRTGRHNLRVGGDAIRFLVKEAWISGYPGNVLHVLRQGTAREVYFFDAPALSEGGVSSWSLYASDAWQTHRRLTLTLGLRLDASRVFLPAQNPPATRPDVAPFAAVDNLIDWKVLAPRAAAAFDVNGNGMSLLKFSYGRYRGAPNAAFAFNSNPNASPWWREHSWTDDNKNGFWDPKEEGPSPNSSSGGTKAESIDPNLTLSVLDEVGGWFERMIPGGATFRTGLIWRLERSQSARQNLLRRFEDFTVPVAVLDRGPDGVAGTVDDGPMLTVYDIEPGLAGQDAVSEVRNVPGSGSEYVTWEIAATRQAHGRWTFGAGFAHTWNGDQAANYSGQAVRNNTYPVTPNDLINTGEGGRHEFTTWTAKAYGTFHGPWNIRLTPLVRHQSGQPFGRTQAAESGQFEIRRLTLLMEPVGSQRLDHLTLVDLRFERATGVGSRRLAVFLDVFNLLNANPEQNLIWVSGPSYFQPLTIVPPRIARAGVSFNW